jgi:hypothetical protein
MPSKGVPPTFKFKVGRVNCSIWRNGDHWGIVFTVSYKDDKDKWAETTQFSRNDLPALASASQFALTLILTDDQKDDSPEDDGR